MPESRPVSKGSISPAVIMSYALMRGGGKLSPKLLAKLGRTTEAGVKADTARAIASSDRPEMLLNFLSPEVIGALVGADLFSGFMLQRPGARRTLEKKVWGKESVEKLDQYRLLSSLGMPVDDNPRLGLNVVKTSDWRGLFRGQQSKMTVSEKQRREMYQEMEKAPWPWTKAGKALSKDLNANVPSIREGRDPMALSDEETRRAIEIFRKHREGR